jgi:hypothetical protein|tara:strand:+ start:203 stop:415 length:213 start_codon:yes stop_codon:yes gene_type:complete
MDNYQQMAIDEVYDILLYNPDVDNEIKINLITNLLVYYTETEEYEKCNNLQELMKVMERPNENNSKKTWW